MKVESKRQLLERNESGSFFTLFYSSIEKLRTDRSVVKLASNETLFLFVPCAICCSRVLVYYVHGEIIVALVSFLYAIIAVNISGEEPMLFLSMHGQESCVPNFAFSLSFFVGKRAAKKREVIRAKVRTHTHRI